MAFFLNEKNFVFAFFTIQSLSFNFFVEKTFSTKNSLRGRILEKTANNDFNMVLDKTFGISPWMSVKVIASLHTS